MAKPGMGEVINETRTGNVLPLSAQTGCCRTLPGCAGGWREGGAGARSGEAGRRPGGGGEGRAAGSARTTLRRPGTPTGESWGRRPASRHPSHPHTPLLSGVCPTVKAPGCSAPSGPRVPQGEDRAAAPHRVDALPLPQPPPPPESSCERPEAARRRPPRRLAAPKALAAGEEGDGTDLKPA